MRGRGWIVGGILAIALIAVVLISQQGAQSSDHSSNSDAVDGASAIRLFSAALGHPTDQISGNFSVPDQGGLMFVFTPTSPYTADEADSVAAWVRGGGVLVYASEGGDPELDRALGSQRIQALVTETSLDAGGPVADGVSKLAGGDYAMPFQLSPQQVAIVRVGPYAVAYLQRLGSGTVIVMSDPLPLTNGYLDQADNGRFAADLLGLVPSAAPVRFDEYHHGITFTDLSPQAWLLTPWGAALLWLLVAVFFGLLLRGRRFGPLLPRHGGTSRAEAEWAVAVGELLRRSGARAVTLGVLAAASERAVAARAGLTVHPRERFWQSLWQRSPDVARELDSAERALYASTASESDLLHAAQRLHTIAYPVSEERRRRSAQ